MYAFAHGRANPQTVERQEQAKLPAVTTGYLASKQNCRSHKKQKWSGRFNGLVEVTNARVILSSTHRLYEETRCGLLAAGILFEGCTADLQTRADHFHERYPLGHESYRFAYEFALIDGSLIYSFRFIVDGSDMAVGVVRVIYVDYETLSPSSD